jgi:hypothetical protein
MYYGGEPADWTNTPNIPKEAYHGASATKPKPLPPPLTTTATAAAGVARNTVGVNRVPQTVLPGQKIVHAHPQAGVGGSQMPEVGRIGGAKGIGSFIQPSSGSGARAGGGGDRGDGKRKRDDKSAKPVSKEEAEFIALREAARQRVQSRDMKAYGLG